MFDSLILLKKDKFVRVHKNAKWKRRNKLRVPDVNIAIPSCLYIIHNFTTWRFGENIMLKLQLGIQYYDLIK